jgi:hypothetical protein
MTSSLFILFAVLLLAMTVMMHSRKRIVGALSKRPWLTKTLMLMSLLALLVLAIMPFIAAFMT